jgi:hypothetical protein
MRSAVSRGSRIGGYLAGRHVGVVLHRVEAQRVPVRVEHLGQDPAQAGPVHAGVGLAELVQPAGEPVDGGLVRHADGEVVESGGGAGPVRVEPQGEVRPAGRMGQSAAHQRALLDELDLDLVAQAAAVPLQRPGQVGDGQLEMVDSRLGPVRLR